MKDIPHPDRLLEEVFGVPGESLSIGALFGDPVQKGGKAFIPVSSSSVRAFGLEGRMRGRPFSHLPEARHSTRLLGHIVVDRSGVRWRPKIGSPKLALSLLALLAAVVRLIRHPTA